MKSDFFCVCCSRYKPISEYKGDLGKKKHCKACYPAAKNKVDRARLNAQKVKVVELSKNDEEKYKMRKKEIHSRAAKIAFQQELKRIEMEMVSYEY